MQPIKSVIQANGRNPDIVFGAASVEIRTEGDSPPAASVVAYTGGLLQLPQFPHPAVINVAGVRAMSSEQLPYLRDHNVERPVGQGVPKITSRDLRHDGVLSFENDDQAEVIAAHRNKFSWQMSVGGRIPNMEKNVQFVAKGRRVRVNGRTFSGPVFVINAFLWKETSFTAVGADEGRAFARIAAATVFEGDAPMNFEEWLQEQGIDPSTLAASAVSNLRAAYDAWHAQQEGDGEGGSGGETATRRQARRQTRRDRSVVTADGSDPDDGDEPPRNRRRQRREDLIRAMLEMEDDGNEIEDDDEDIENRVVQAAIRATREETQRSRRIDALFASYPSTSLTEDQRSQLRAQVEDGEISEDRAHLQLIQASRGHGSTTVISVGSRNSGANHYMDIAASLAVNAGLSEDQTHDYLIEAGATQNAAEDAVSRCRGKHGIRSLIRAVCRQENYHVDEVDDDAIQCALQASARDLATPGYIRASSGGFSTVSLVGILSRLANKAMLVSYEDADNGGVALQISSQTSTSDFKKFTRYRMTESGVMEKVPATGEIPHGTMTESTFENQVSTYGKMFALSRQMMRNDDLDAFLQIPRMLGRMGRHALEQATITLLVNAAVAAGAGTTEFFHGAARGNEQPNYFSGASSALSFESLETAYELFLNQTDSDGKPIMIDPAILLVTNGDIVLARKLYNDTEYRFTTSDTRETINNQWMGMFQPLKSSYFGTLGSTPSTNHWMLMGQPNQDMAPIQIAFLDNQRTPMISQAEAAFNVLGLQMRGVFDFGVALFDPRTVVKSKGSA